MVGSEEKDERPAIRIEGLQKSFGKGEEAVTAVENVSFEVEKGEVVGILGPNGAGKTTTIKSILGLIKPDAGSIKVDGIDVEDDPHRVHGRIGAMLEGARNIYWRLTVRENLRFFAGLGGESPDEVEDRHEELLERFDLADRADTPVRELSRGMQQKVSLASTLARDVDVVFLDEPTLGLDIETSHELRTELTRLRDERDITILVCSHDMDVIEEVCDRVVVLNEGSVVTHESIDTLLDLFHTREFEVTLDGPLPDDVCQQLAERADADCARKGPKFVVNFIAGDTEEIFTVIDILRETDSEIREIESLKPDLEKIYLDLTDDEREEDAANETPAVSTEGQI